jgi:hypothetical protein
MALKTVQEGEKKYYAKVFFMSEFFFKREVGDVNFSVFCFTLGCMELAGTVRSSSQTF